MRKDIYTAIQKALHQRGELVASRESIEVIAEVVAEMAMKERDVHWSQTVVAAREARGKADLEVERLKREDVETRKAALAMQDSIREAAELQVDTMRDVCEAAKDYFKKHYWEQGYVGTSVPTVNRLGHTLEALEKHNANVTRIEGDSSGHIIHDKGGGDMVVQRVDVDPNAGFDSLMDGKDRDFRVESDGSHLPKSDIEVHCPCCARQLKSIDFGDTSGNGPEDLRHTRLDKDAVVFVLNNGKEIRLGK